MQSGRVGAFARGYTETAHKQEEDPGRRIRRRSVKVYGGVGEGGGGDVQKNLQKGLSNCSRFNKFLIQFPPPPLLCQIFEIPFNSTDKFQANVYLCGNRHVVFLKGAPERVLERCSTVAFDNETRMLDDEIKEAYTESCYVLANNGERVLGFADLDLPVSAFPPGFAFEEDPPNFPLDNLRLVKKKKKKGRVS